MSTTQEQKDVIFHYANQEIKGIISFVVQHRVAEYLFSQAQSNFSDFEYELDESHAIKSINFTANLNNLQDMDGIIDFEADIFSGDITCGMQYPFEAASSSYIFTRMEIFGNDVSALVKPGAIGDYRAWHNCCSKGSLQDKFGCPFDIPSEDIPTYIVEHLKWLRNKRNETAHEGQYGANFEEFVGKALSIIAFIGLYLSGYPQIRCEITS